MATITSDLREPTFAASVEAASAAVLVADAEGRVLAANRLACGLLGRGHVELIGLDMSDVGLAPLALSRVRAEADERGVTFGAGQLRDRNGRVVPVRCQVTRIDSDDGPVYLWVAHPRRSARRPAGRDPARRRSACELRLTERELEIVQLIADGLGNQDIARELSVSVETVKTHVRRMLGKLQARGRAHAVAIAWRRDLVD